MMFFVPFSVFEYLNNYPEQVNWDIFFGEFEYDHISDDIISLYLNNSTTKLIKLDIPWEKDNKSSDYHAQRIAAMIIKINEGVELDPVIFELSQYNRNWNMVHDGNHRIRAYKFLKKKGFYAEFGGSVDLINQFEQLCIQFSK